MTLVEPKFKNNNKIQDPNETIIYDQSKECEKGNFYMLLKEDYREVSELIEVYEDFVNKENDDAEKIETKLTEN